MTSESAVSPSSPPSHKWRDIVIMAGIFALMILGLAGLALATGWAETKAHLIHLTGMQICILLALSMVNYLARAIRWHFFTRQMKMPTYFLQSIRHYIGGFAMSATPGRVGELIRMRWIKRETGWSFDKIAPLVLVDRAADLAAMAIILGIALYFSTAGIAGAVPVASFALLSAIVFTRPALLAKIVTIGYRSTGLFPRLMGKVRRASKSLGFFSHPVTFSISSGLGILGWMAEGYAFYVLLIWLESDVTFWTAMAIFVFSTLAGGLTGAPGGVGGAEVAIVALLTLQGTPIDSAVAATLIIRLVTLWFAIALGFVVFPFAERTTARPAVERHEPLPQCGRFSESDQGDASHNIDPNIKHF
ncbi:lysylphosphatidylglycerol synthase transmembrane domain-containing protein [Parasulfitobacter algicola]|uniref:Flippase-like domain-containing protein n=1 Tax=Parasulfitobacter algicola TaxID=2614809 RepID=A0ABX2ISY7_9RHOB|nr:lysylphosphatidylglycerol synthase transmembrane domain-containing protein [Sulfitobacter algicola]NSX55996.1 flippase-like domain-containing protein [Sulfitobacter algicola]